mgnify:CR=1 FL=1
MRVTRIKGIELSGYYNPSEHAQKVWRSLQGTQWEMSRAQAYREQLNETFAKYAFPGGYSVLATTDNADVFCADCARKVFLDERIDVSLDVYWEGADMRCDECSCLIESAYGDPEELEDE